MAESVALCPYCGNEVSCNTDLKTTKCTSCKRTYVVKHGINLINLNQNPKKVLVSAREGFTKALQKNNIEEMYLTTETLINLLPDDFEARYFYAYAQQHRHHPKYMEMFLTSNPHNSTDESVEKVINHIFEHSNPHDYKAVKAFIELLKPKDLVAFEQIHATRKSMSENYAMIPRDAFICHHPNDEVIANRVVKSLEEENHRCWIETRNLNPIANENRIQSIKEAITSCAVFIVISSKDAMLSQDVIDMITIAKTLDKARLEFKIDSTQHTALFKEFFLALSPLEAVVDIRSAFEALKPRFFKKLLEVKKANTLHNKKTGKPEDVLVEQAKKELENRRFDIAEDLVDRALEMNLENATGWLIKWLAKHEFISLNEIKSFYDNENDIFGVIDLFSSKELTTAKQFDYTKELTPYLQLFETYIKNEIKDLEKSLDKSHLQELIKYLPGNLDLSWMTVLFEHHIYSNNHLESMISDPKYINTLNGFFESPSYKKCKRMFPLNHSYLEFEIKFNDSKTSLDETALKEIELVAAKTTDLEHQIINALLRSAFKKALKLSKKIPEKTVESIAQKSYYVFLSTHQFRDEEHAHEYMKDPSHLNNTQKIINSKSYQEMIKHYQHQSFIQSLKADIIDAENHIVDYKNQQKRIHRTKNLKALVSIANQYILFAIIISMFLMVIGLLDKVNTTDSIYYGYPMLLFFGSAFLLPLVLIYRDKAYKTLHPDAQHRFLKFKMVMMVILWVLFAFTLSIGYYFFVHKILTQNNFGYIANIVGFLGLIFSYWVFLRSISNKRRIHEFKFRWRFWILVVIPFLSILGFTIYTALFS